MNTLTPALTRDKIIAEFTAKIKDFQKMAYNIAGIQDKDDLFQEVALMLLEFPEDRLISYYNPTQGLKPIFLRMLCNQYKSKTSKFHKKYRKEEQFIQSKGRDIVHNEQATELEAFEIPMSDMENARDNVYRLNGEMFASPLEDMIFRLYTETGSLRKALAAIDADEVKLLSDKEVCQLFDLKTVHTIVLKYRRTIKKHFNIAA